MPEFDGFAVFLTLAATLLTAPLLQGVIKKEKAFWQGRHGPPLLQPYFDLVKLARKGSILPHPSSGVFRMAPLVVCGATLVAAALVPIVRTRSPLGTGDVILVVGCLALGRFSLALAALDTGSTFAGMGASRDLAIAALIEPALLAIVFALVIPAGSTDLGRLVVTALPNGPAPATLLALGALLIVALAETGRIPVDNPDTHLELTMVHEGMLMEYSGRRLLLLTASALVKQVVVLSLIIDLVLPWGTSAPLALAFAIWVGKVLLLGGLLGCVETGYAKLRILRLPDLLASAFALGGLSLITRSVWGG